MHGNCGGFHVKRSLPLHSRGFADVLLASAVNCDVVTLAVRGYLAAAGLQRVATCCVVVKWAGLVCLRLWVLRSLRAAAQLQRNAASTLGA